MTRLTIDWDADGAYAVITRPGQAAEVVRLPDVDRTATEAMTAALAMRGKVVVRPARWPHSGCEVAVATRSENHPVLSTDAPPHFIGALGE